MKTAEEIINKRWKKWNDAHPNEKVKFSQTFINEVVKAMQKYAEQAIDKCAEDAELYYDIITDSDIVNPNTILSVKQDLK